MTWGASFVWPNLLLDVLRGLAEPDAAPVRGAALLADEYHEAVPDTG
jgi:hypothetical protein